MDDRSAIPAGERTEIVFIGRVLRCLVDRAGQRRQPKNTARPIVFIFAKAPKSGCIAKSRTKSPTAASAREHASNNRYSRSDCVTKRLTPRQNVTRILATMAGVVLLVRANDLFSHAMFARMRPAAVSLVPDTSSTATHSGLPVPRGPAILSRMGTKSRETIYGASVPGGRVLWRA